MTIFFFFIFQRKQVLTFHVNFFNQNCWYFPTSPQNICWVTYLKCLSETYTNECPQHMFSWRNKKFFFFFPNTPPILSYVHWPIYAKWTPLPLLFRLVHFQYRGVWLDFIITMFYRNSRILCQHVDPDQMQHSGASDLGLHGLPLSLLHIENTSYLFGPRITFHCAWTGRKVGSRWRKLYGCKNIRICLALSVDCAIFWQWPVVVSCSHN